MDSGPDGESLIEEVTGGVIFGLVGLHRKDGLTGKSVIISRNCLALEGTDPPGLARFWMSKQWNKKTCNT